MCQSCKIIFFCTAESGFLNNIPHKSGGLRKYQFIFFIFSIWIWCIILKSRSNLLQKRTKPKAHTINISVLPQNSKRMPWIFSKKDWCSQTNRSVITNNYKHVCLPTHKIWTGFQGMWHQDCISCPIFRIKEWLIDKT